jgi:glucose/mannose transport system permease protein
MTATRVLGRIPLYGGLALFALIVLAPIYIMVITSLKPPAEAVLSRMWDLPSDLSFAAWNSAFSTLRPYLINSFSLAIPATVLSALLGSLNGYVFAKWRFRGSEVVFNALLFGLFIPYQIVLIPLVVTLQAMGLYNSIAGLVFVHVVYGIPITTLIFRNYYQTVPHELIESARVDGAGMLRTYWSVVLPISVPSFVVVLIWQFTSAWNDFLFGLVLTSRSDWPVTIALNNIAGSQVVPFHQAMAAALLASIPTLVVYVLMGRFFMRGLMAGALKG